MERDNSSVLMLVFENGNGKVCISESERWILGRVYKQQIQKMNASLLEYTYAYTMHGGLDKRGRNKNEIRLKERKKRHGIIQSEIHLQMQLHKHNSWAEWETEKKQSCSCSSSNRSIHEFQARIIKCISPIRMCNARNSVIMQKQSKIKTLVHFFLLLRLCKYMCFFSARTQQATRSTWRRTVFQMNCQTATNKKRIA